MQVYRLLRDRGGKPATIVHGVNGSRTLPLDTWLEANVRWTHNPGATSQTHYWCGFHVFPDKLTAWKYRFRFKAGDRPLIVPCEVEDTWQKPTNPDVLMARWLKISSEHWHKQLEEAA